MTPRPGRAFFASINWRSESHQACVARAFGTLLGEQAFPQSGKGLGQLVDWSHGRSADAAGQVGVAIEIPHGPVVDTLLDRGFQICSIDPQQLDRFRNHFSPAWAQGDLFDACVLADRSAHTHLQFLVAATGLETRCRQVIQVVSRSLPALLSAPDMPEWESCEIAWGSF